MLRAAKRTTVLILFVDRELTEAAKGKRFPWDGSSKSPLPGQCSYQLTRNSSSSLVSEMGQNFPGVKSASLLFLSCYGWQEAVLKEGGARMERQAQAGPRWLTCP